MEIRSYNNIPQDPNRRATPKAKAEGEASPVAQDQFVGPNVEGKIKKLGEIDASRETLVAELKNEIEEGRYLNEERLQSTVEKLLASL
jgi:anti-sigma28 factor (negative regulator of flagellin synthesis)